MDSFFRNMNGSFNRFTNLDSLEWRIVHHLLNSKTKSAENVWKLLFHNTPDCLLKPNLTREEKLSLIFTGQEKETDKKVFIVPFVGQAWEKESTRLHIYVDGVLPQNKMQSTVLIAVELVTHEKLGVILGESTGDDPYIGNNQFQDNGNPLVLYKNRLTLMLQHILAELNGLYVESVGVLEFNQQMNRSNLATHSLWNNKSVYGFGIKLSTIISALDNEDC